jgi:hypothetical protein
MMRVRALGLKGYTSQSPEIAPCIPLIRGEIASLSMARPAPTEPGADNPCTSAHYFASIYATTQVEVLRRPAPSAASYEATANGPTAITALSSPLHPT